MNVFNYNSTTFSQHIFWKLALAYVAYMSLFNLLWYTNRQCVNTKKKWIILIWRLTLISHQWQQNLDPNDFKIHQYLSYFLKKLIFLPWSCCHNHYRNEYCKTLSAQWETLECNFNDNIELAIIVLGCIWLKSQSDGSRCLNYHPDYNS